jgi:hypothetical protein
MKLKIGSKEVGRLAINPASGGRGTAPQAGGAPEPAQLKRERTQAAGDDDDVLFVSESAEAGGKARPKRAARKRSKLEEPAGSSEGAAEADEEEEADEAMAPKAAKPKAERKKRARKQSSKARPSLHPFFSIARSVERHRETHEFETCVSSAVRPGLQRGWCAPGCKLASGGCPA